MQVVPSEYISIMGKYTTEDCPGCSLPLWRICVMPGQLKVAWLKLNAATSGYQHTSHNLDHFEWLEIYYYDVNVCKTKLDYHYGKIHFKVL